MKRLIIVFILGLLCINISNAYSTDTIYDANICDCNCVYNPDTNSCDCNCLCKEPEPLPKAYLFEDFNDILALNWKIFGNDPCNWSLKTVPGSLTITTQDGTFERSRTDGNNLFLVSFPVVPTKDFQVTTCISNYYPVNLWNQAGLMLWQDEDNFFKLVYEFGEGPPPNNEVKLLFTAALEFYGYPTYGWFETEQFSQKMWLRIIKRGDRYELYYSTDGKTFNPMEVLLPAVLTKDNKIPGTFFKLKYMGLFANNGSAYDTPQVDASFDFFEFKVLPVDPNTIEDPNDK